MTKDTSPENLRKFLESDDPALVTMGLSMAKGSGVPDDLLGEILWMYMFHGNATIRTAAKSTFMKLAPEDAKQAVKENWKESYLTEKYGPDGYVMNYSLHSFHPFLVLNILGKALRHTSVSLVEPLIKALSDGAWAQRHTSRALEKVPTEYGEFIHTPCSFLNDDLVLLPSGAPKQLRHITAKENKNLNAEGKRRTPLTLLRRHAAKALGEIGDERAVEPLIKALSDNWVSEDVAKALENIGDERAVEPLIEFLSDENCAFNPAKTLGKIGDERAVEPLINMLSRVSHRVYWDRTKHYGPNIGERTQAIRVQAINALLEIENVKGLKIALNDTNQYVRNTAKEALRELGHEVE